MPEKRGNGGYGPEDYNPANGQYIQDGEANSSYDNPNEKVASATRGQALSFINRPSNKDLLDFYNSLDDADKDAFLDAVIKEMQLGDEEPSAETPSTETPSTETPKVRELTSYPDINTMSDAELDKEIDENCKEILGPKGQFECRNFKMMFNGDKKLQCASSRALRYMSELYPLNLGYKIPIRMSNATSYVVAEYFDIKRDLDDYYEIMPTELKYSNENMTTTRLSRKEKLHVPSEDGFYDNGIYGYSRTPFNQFYAPGMLTYAVSIHEYGHFMEDSFLYKNKKSLGYNFSEAKNVLNNYCDDIKNEVIDIFNKNNPGEDYKNYASLYAQTKKKPAEFFAEMTAGMLCGKPNKLTDAFKEWLDKNYKK